MRSACIGFNRHLTGKGWFGDMVWPPGAGDVEWGGGGNENKESTPRRKLFVIARSSDCRVLSQQPETAQLPVSILTLRHLISKSDHTGEQTTEDHSESIGQLTVLVIPITALKRECLRGPRIVLGWKPSGSLPGLRDIRLRNVPEVCHLLRCSHSCIFRHDHSSTSRGPPEGSQRADHGDMQLVPC